MDFLKSRYTPMSRRRRIYEGKAKVLYEGPEPGTLIQHFKDDATAFNAKVNEGNAKFQQAIADEKFTARRPVLIDLKGQFDADAAHLRSKASRGKVTPALASEMKKDVNKIYDHALGR